MNAKNEEINVVEDENPDRFLEKAKRDAMDVHNALTSGPQLTPNNFYIVWFAKTLQNWKALVATNVPDDGLYYEVTYNGDRHETYVDTYKKQSNFVIADIPAH